MLVPFFYQILTNCSCLGGYCVGLECGYCMELKYGYWINIILFRVKRPFDWLAFFTLAGFLYIEVTSFIWLAGFVSVKLMLWGERAV